MKVLIALVGFLSNPGTLMGPTQAPGAGGYNPVSPFSITTESDDLLTTESDQVLYTEAAP